MPHNFRERLIRLHHCGNMSWKRIYTLLKTDPGLYSLNNCPSKNKIPQATETIADFHSHQIHENIKQYSKLGIQIITFFDSIYPSMLKEIYQPPWVLYAKGDLSLLQKQRKLAVVGSRNATVYSKEVIKAIMKELVEERVVIVSGLAKGVDTIAHMTADEHNGKTIAIIAGGFNHIYPKENLLLAETIKESHLLLSEYPPDTKPLKWHFPMRNRIISGISRGTLVVEAKRKSGSLITANLALQEGRDVFAVPGSIFSPNSYGANDLIKQGSKPVSSASDIIEEWEFYS